VYAIGYKKSKGSNPRGCKTSLVLITRFAIVLFGFSLTSLFLRWLNVQWLLQFLSVCSCVVCFSFVSLLREAAVAAVVISLRFEMFVGLLCICVTLLLVLMLIVDDFM
jgi:hypothetical protein